MTMTVASTETRTGDEDRDHDPRDDARAKFPGRGIRLDGERTRGA